MAGIMSGAVTNTAGLAAAQAAVGDLNITGTDNIAHYPGLCGHVSAWGIWDHRNPAVTQKDMGYEFEGRAGIAQKSGASDIQ